MALTWTRLLQILNGGIAVFSLTLVGIAPACLYLTSHGMQWMNQMWRPGLYEWYRGEGPWGDQHHFVTLSYDTVNEGLILAAASVSLLAGLIGAYGAFLRRKNAKLGNLKSTLLAQIVPGVVTFLVTFIAFVYTQAKFDVESKPGGTCYWPDGYATNTNFVCTREQAACGIVGYFINYKSVYDVQPIFDAKRGICGETQTGRHLLAALFAVSVALCASAVGKFVVEKREMRWVETPDERVDRLARQED